jgi:exodeoxyribonuclease VII small subunit
MKKSYEELISELKEIVRKIEDNETGLDESIALYEQGAVILKQCEDLLASAELKITMLGRDEQPAR